MSAPNTPSPGLNDAVSLHEAGQLQDAEDAYRQILDAAPARVDAAHGLALVTLDLGRPEDAIPLLTRCTTVEPANPSYRLSLGVALLQAGKTTNAEVQFRDLINTTPKMVEAHLYLARTLRALNRWVDAADLMNAASKQFSDHPDVWTAKGQVERVLLRHPDAEQSYREALRLKPGDPDCLNNLAVVVRAQHRFDEAVALYLEALEAAPNHPKVHGNLGNALVEMGRAAEAELHLRKAAHLNPSDPSSLCNLAVFLTREDRSEEAIAYFNTTIKIAPLYVDAWINLGVARLALGDTQGAEDCYRRAIEIAPENPEAHYNLAWVLLLTGRWTEGWQEYEWRWKLEHFSSHRRAFKHPLWDGAPLPGGTLLLHAEQGLGDAIQFARYVPLAKERCARVIVECHKPLVPLFETLLGADAIIAAGDTLPPFDAHAPFMSLARIFAAAPDATSIQTPYLAAPSPTPSRLTLPDSKRPRIGLVWAGSPDNKIDRHRSISAELFVPLIASVDADFVSLQVGPCAEDISGLPGDRLVFACDGQVRDFSETAAVISQLDLVLGVDTAVMHLAGALGKPVWMLLPFMPDYRWLLGRDDTPWYSSMRLFRQAKAGDWIPLIANVSDKLKQWLFHSAKDSR